MPNDALIGCPVFRCLLYFTKRPSSLDFQGVKNFSCCQNYLTYGIIFYIRILQNDPTYSIFHISGPSTFEPVPELGGGELRRHVHQRRGHEEVCGCEQRKTKSCTRNHLQTDQRKISLNKANPLFLATMTIEICVALYNALA